MPGKLWKTEIVIWSDSDPRKMELSALAHDAECGDSYCASLKTKLVDDPEADPDWDGTDFFDTGL